MEAWKLATLDYDIIRLSLSDITKNNLSKVYFATLFAIIFLLQHFSELLLCDDAVPIIVLLCNHLLSIRNL